MSEVVNGQVFLAGRAVAEGSRQKRGSPGRFASNSSFYVGFQIYLILSLLYITHLHIMS